jgi:membrane-bound lytic murein transglycosylase D
VNLVDAADIYARTSLTLLAAALLFSGLRRLDAKTAAPFRHRHLLHIGYALCVAALLLPPLAAVLPTSHALIPEPVQIWSGSSMHGVADAAPDARIAFATAPAGLSLPLGTAAMVLAGIIAAGTLAMMGRVGRDLFAALRIVRGATSLRTRGRVQLLVSDSTDVPFSLWMPGRSVIVIPAGYLLRPDDLRLALRHEAQHHRQWDTPLIHVLQIVRALFWWHPGVHALVRHLLELQEFACDEAVTARGDTSAQAYCQCLLRAAEESRHQPCRTGIGMTGTASALLRRVHAALHPPHSHRRARTALLAAVAAVVSIGALAAASPIRDHRLTLEDAQRLARDTRSDERFPLVVNDAVVAELNRLLGTPDGRSWLRDSLTRMRAHQPQIEVQLTRYNLPRALLAVPLVESGYRNRKAGIGAGLWMFIVPTARRFGLDIGPNHDERLDIPLETDAAMRLLSSLHAQFKDWRLALLAYNIGEVRVEQAMQGGRYRDAGEIVIALPGDNYVPRVMAAALILENPGLLDED